jgi:hypothetical protein
MFLASDAVRTPEFLDGGDRGQITMSSLGNNGRFANQLFQYAFMKLYALRHGVKMAIPDWQGRKLFGLKDTSSERMRLPDTALGPVAVPVRAERRVPAQRQQVEVEVDSEALDPAVGPLDVPGVHRSAPICRPRRGVFLVELQDYCCQSQDRPYDDRRLALHPLRRFAHGRQNSRYRRELQAPRWQADAPHPDIIRRVSPSKIPGIP